MALSMMQLVGYTAGFDALLAAVSWLIIHVRLKKSLYPVASDIVSAFKSYLVWTTLFLLLTATAMLWLTGTVQGVVVFVSDLFLWAALFYLVRLAGVGHSKKWVAFAMTLFVLAAGAGSLFQVAGLMGLELNFRPVVTYILANMAPLLMYAVWVPISILFLIEGVRTDNRLARQRLWLLAAGLLLTTFSWAWRLLVVTPSVPTIVVSSLLGFAFILGGVLQRRS